MKFLTSIDLLQNELQNAVIQPLATAPANAVAGQIYYNSTKKTLEQFDGTAWNTVGKEYTLPVATADTLGGIKVGGGLQITDTGVLSATGGGVADSVEWDGVLDTPTTIAGYGIVDAKIDNGVITLGTATITPVTSVNGKTGSSVTLAASDVGALASDTTYVESVDGQSGAVTTNAVKYTEQTLTDEQKSQARANIGAGTSDFSGSYNDLADKPTIDATLSTTSTNAVQNKAVTVELNKKYDATNEPPYPVTSVDGATGAVVLNDVKYTEQTLTEAQKTQARANIGAGTSSFSGKYADLTGLPTVDTTMSADSTNAVQNKVIKAYVDGIVAASQGIVYKGVINSADDIPTTYNVGDLYMIATAGTYVGQVCEVGDLMIAVVGRKGTGNENSDWDVIQTNIEGAITEITGDAPINVTGTGTSREIALADSGVTTGGYGDTTAQTPAFGATFKVPSFTVDQYGRLTAAGEHTVTIPATVATDDASGIMSASDHKALTDGLKDISTLKTQVMTKVVATITAGETSGTATLTEGASVLSVMASNATTGEQVLVDTTTSGTTFTATIAKAVGYDVTVVAVVL